MSASSIEWTNKTWNPLVGCSMVSPGCARCYAETMSNRLAGMTVADLFAGREPGRKRHYLDVINDKGRWNGKVQLVPEALLDPLKWKKPCRVFVNSMSDLFHEDVPFEYSDKVFAVMALCPQHTFQVLTKRPRRMAEYFSTDAHARSQGAAIKAGWMTPGPAFCYRAWSWPLRNVWLGTSIEDQERADERLPIIEAIPAAIRFLSVEPLLEEVYLGDEFNDGKTEIDWVIVGGESGPGARRCRVQWIDSIVAQCQAAGVPCFVKQLGANVDHEYLKCSKCGHIDVDQAFDVAGADDGNAFCNNCGHEVPLVRQKIKDKKGGNPGEWPADLRVRQFPEVLR